MEPIDVSSSWASDHLPHFCLEVPSGTKTLEDAEVPPSAQSLLPDATVNGCVIQQETEWLQYVQNHCSDVPAKDPCLSWAVFYANEYKL